MTENKALREWQALAVRLETYLPRMPYAAADHAALIEVVSRLEASMHEEEFLRARLGVLRGLRHNDVDQARELRNRLAAFVRATFGAHDGRLADCGLASKKKRPGRTVRIE
ncbi:MAG TPA: hypothetical protein VEG34_15185 [Thermoanaerobaculia bacterium]|nr:hypothetical protein [Thermoanaerobaculia bacterium]